MRYVPLGMTTAETVLDLIKQKKNGIWNNKIPELNPNLISD